MAERPWMKFFTSDWRGSTRLRSSSAGARALLMEMMCIMHVAEPYGHLAIAGEPITDDADIAKHVTMSKTEVRRWRLELLAKGLIAQTPDGVIYNPRMVRDEEIRRKRAAGGKKGGNPALKDNPKDNLSVNGKDNHKGYPQMPDARGQKQKRVREHPKRIETTPTPIAAVIGSILPNGET